MLTHRLSLAMPLFLLAVGCSGAAAGPDNNDSGGGAGPSAGTTSTGTSGTTTSMPSGGTSSAGGAAVVVTLAGSGQAVGGGDQGSLFPPDGSVPIMPVETGGSGGSGSVIPGDGKMVTSMIRGSINGTAVFSQKGEDVTVVVNLSSGCADGKHMFRIYDGDSCDNASTEGMPWTPRGVGFGPADGTPCSGGKGMMMDVRSGADKTKNVTVGDHEFMTDVTTHVVIVSDEKDPNSRASCGNFF
jgi:hypothetical protein